MIQTVFVPILINFNWPYLKVYYLSFQITGGIYIYIDSLGRPSLIIYGIMKIFLHNFRRRDKSFKTISRFVCINFSEQNISSISHLRHIFVSFITEIQFNQKMFYIYNTNSN